MSNKINKITDCEVCGNHTLEKILDLGLHPMCDDLVRFEDMRVCKNYPIKILFCNNCITAHQQYQIPKDELFPFDYHYRARHTSDVLKGMRDLVNSCHERENGLVDKKVLDIGCNDGSLLSIFAEYGTKTYGIEPTGAAHDAMENGQHTIINDFFDADTAKRFLESYGHPDVITFTNVFAHIEDLGGLIKALNILKGSNSVIIVENHYLGSILEKNQFDTFYHEHPRTYSYTSFRYIAKALGMSISKVDFPKRYGGNIRIFMEHQGELKESDALDQLDRKEQSYGNDLGALSIKIKTWQKNKRAEINAAVKEHDKLSAKAFPGRAAIPIKLLGLDETLISGVYEKPGSGKIGHYVPGTRIPIFSDNDFIADSAPLINFAWHISNEIKSYLRSRGFSGQIIDITSEADFH